jgi:hypothetical protein
MLKRLYCRLKHSDRLFSNLQKHRYLTQHTHALQPVFPRSVTYPLPKDVAVRESFRRKFTQVLVPNNYEICLERF